MLRKETVDYIKKEKDDYGILNYHVLESMADWVRVIDKDGTIIYANKTMKDAFEDNMVGKKCDKVGCRKKPCNFCITQRSISTGEVVQKEEIIRERYYSVKSSPVTNSQGEIFAAVEVFRDVTRERKLELELIERNKKMSKDLGFAKRIQQRILPNREVFGNVTFDYVYKASEMLSGDMFDVFHIDEENMGIYIADVSGHGVSASMMTMFIRQTMRFIVEEIKTPAVALSELHRRFSLLNLDVDKYFTMFYGVFNKTTYEFKYANAGHNCIPIKFNKDSMEMLNAKGFPIVLIFDDMNYKEKMIQLKKGDKILFYTDGITESRDRNGIEFGTDRVIDIVKKNNGNNNRTILGEIEESVLNYTWGDQQDDLALVLMEVIQ